MNQPIGPSELMFLRLGLAFGFGIGMFFALTLGVLMGVCK